MALVWDFVVKKHKGVIRSSNLGSLSHHRWVQLSGHTQGISVDATIWLDFANEHSNIHTRDSEWTLLRFNYVRTQGFNPHMKIRVDPRWSTRRGYDTFLARQLVLHLSMHCLYVLEPQGQYWENTTYESLSKIISLPVNDRSLFSKLYCGIWTKLLSIHCLHSVAGRGTLHLHT